MRLEPLYRVRFSYPEGWDVELEGGWEQHLYLAEGRCEGFLSGRFRGANYPQRRTPGGPFRPDIRAAIEHRRRRDDPGRAPRVRTPLPSRTPADRRLGAASQRRRALPPSQRRGVRLRGRGASVAGPGEPRPGHRRRRDHLGTHRRLIVSAEVRTIRLRPRRCTARALRSASPRPASIASPTTRRLVSSWGTGAPTPPARAAARSRSLATRSRAKATGGVLGVLVRRPLVGHERRGDRAVRDHLVRQLPLDAGLLGQHQRLGQGLVEPEDHRVDGQLHGRARTRAGRAG